MAKQKLKYKLEIDYDREIDFILIGVVCHEKDYRFCWMMNNSLSMDFVKKETEIRLSQGKKKTESSHSVFHHRSEEIFTDFYIIVNKSQEGALIPEQKQADYFLLIRGNITDEEREELVRRIRETENVITAFEIDPSGLKSKQNLLF